VGAEFGCLRAQRFSSAVIDGSAGMLFDETAMRSLEFRTGLHL